MIDDQEDNMKGKKSSKEVKNMCQNLTRFKNDPFIVKKDNEGKYEPD